MAWFEPSCLGCLSALAKPRLREERGGIWAAIDTTLGPLLAVEQQGEKLVQIFSKFRFSTSGMKRQIWTMQVKEEIRVRSGMGTRRKRMKMERGYL